MLGNDAPHALQGSFQPGSQADLCLTTAIHTLDEQAYSAPYRMVINNDERQFNAPGVRVPMLSISRVEQRNSPTWPYPEYHSSHDTPELTTPERLQDFQECDPWSDSRLGSKINMWLTNSKEKSFALDTASGSITAQIRRGIAACLKLWSAVMASEPSQRLPHNSAFLTNPFGMLSIYCIVKTWLL